MGYKEIVGYKEFVGYREVVGNERQQAQLVHRPKRVRRLHIR